MLEKSDLQVNKILGRIKVKSMFMGEYDEG